MVALVLGVGMFQSKVCLGLIAAEDANQLFSSGQLSENWDDGVLLDSDALYEIYFRSLKLTTPTSVDHLVSVSISGLTSCSRFSGQLNLDPRKVAMNVIFPPLHQVSQRCQDLNCVPSQNVSFTNTCAFLKEFASARSFRRGTLHHHQLRVLCITQVIAPAKDFYRFGVRTLRNTRRSPEEVSFVHRHIGIRPLV